MRYVDGSRTVSCSRDNIEFRFRFAYVLTGETIPRFRVPLSYQSIIASSNQPNASLTIGVLVTPSDPADL